MKIRCCTVMAVLLVTGLSCSTGGEATDPAAEVGEATVDEQIVGLEESCAASADARLRRHEQEPLYSRLGEYERIRRLTGEIVSLHLQNDSIRHLFEGVDTVRLADLVADFMAGGTGGDQQYEGRDMRTAHAHLALTDEHFLSAGGDVGQAMLNLEYGQDEIDEVTCILVSLREQVVGH